MKIKKIIISLITVIFVIDILLFSSFCFVSYNHQTKENIDISTSTDELIISDSLLSQPVFIKTIPDLHNDLIAGKQDFLEVNLSDMKTRIYKNGEVILEVSILAKGDLLSWGGTAAGLYKIISKTKVAWSGAAKVYMPYAIHFYGKYFIHGEPYYPNGEKMISDFSGGCVRLSDQDSKTVFNAVKIGMTVLVIDNENDDYVYKTRELAQLPIISAQNYLVADLDNSFVFTQKNQNQSVPIASLTKLMAAVIVSENVNLEKYITVTQKMLDLGYGSTEKLVAGEEYRAIELFYPLLVESSNDAAEVLAGFLSRNFTIAEMNEKAKEILMDNTTYYDISGYDPANYSTAQDLFQLTRYILNNRPLIWQITKNEQVRTFGDNRFFDANFWNKNIFYLDPTLIGGKTGFIKTSKNTGIFLFKFLDEHAKTRNVAFIVLGSDDLKNDIQLLYKWVNQNYFSPL